MVLLQEPYHVLWKIGIVFVGIRYLEGIEHCIEDHSDLEEEVVLNRTNVDDIFLHQEGLFIGLEKYIEVGA